MIPYCNHTGVGLIPWSPIARGALARPWKSRDTHREMTDNILTDMVRSHEYAADEAIIGRVEEIADQIGKSMAQVAIAWSLSKRDVCPIVGLGSRQRMDEAVLSKE